MAEPYTTVAAVAGYLGVDVATLSGLQSAQVAANISAATRYAENRTKQRWNVPPLTAVRTAIPTSTLFLELAPVASVESIQVRTRAVGDSYELLEAGVDYELLDPDTGEVALARGYGDGALGLIAYTPNRPAPDDVTLAVTMIAGATSYLVLFPDRNGIEKVQVEQGAQIQYSDQGEMLAVPRLARELLERLVLPIWG